MSIYHNFTVGEKVHLHFKPGLWTIKAINDCRITLGYSKHNENTFTVDFGSIKCRQGGDTNFRKKLREVDYMKK
jgi:hypothetical protein